ADAVHERRYPAGGLLGRGQQQRHRHPDEREARDQAQRHHDALPPLAGEQLQRGHQQGQQDRRDDQVRVHGVPSPPSTWSLPLRPREVSSTTRNSAVVAKPITIAVSTSACGSGSVYCSNLPTTSPRTGSAPMRRPPVEKMNRLTP